MNKYQVVIVTSTAAVFVENIEAVSLVAALEKAKEFNDKYRRIEKITIEETF